MDRILYGSLTSYEPPCPISQVILAAENQEFDIKYSCRTQLLVHYWMFHISLPITFFFSRIDGSLYRALISCLISTTWELFVNIHGWVMRIVCNRLPVLMLCESRCWIKENSTSYIKIQYAILKSIRLLWSSRRNQS